METGTLQLEHVEAKYSFLKDSGNRWMEFYYALHPQKTEPIGEQMRALERAETGLLGSLGIDESTAVMKRFFSSDLINHRTEILSYKERRKTDFFLSLTEQPPVPAAKLAMLGLCLSNVATKERRGDLFLFNTTSGIRHIFAEHLTASNSDEDAEQQTARVFGDLEKRLAEFGASIEDSVLRTWIYAPHLDADYPGIVRARKAFFDSVNLTRDTHYIASTGIQGGTGDRFARVSVDAYAVTGIDRNDVRYIQAPEYLSPAHTYGVTFERATAVRMGDTDFLFISGTASINKEGEVVHPGDVVKQTEHTLTNISALLAAAGFCREDLSSLIVYLRDPTDYDFVQSTIAEYSRNLPAVYVKAPVCRPGWLIEIEAAAGKFIGRKSSAMSLGSL